MFCGECRAENAEGLRWCTSCGADLQAQRTPTGATPRPTPPPGGTIGGVLTEQPVAETGAFEEGAAVGPDGRYEIGSELGRGGMGIVYRAIDRLMGEPVALKVMLPSLLESESAKRRFTSEATLARKLTHPHVVRVHGADVHGELQLLVMECLEGKTLREELKALKAAGEPMAVKRAAEIARQCCAALEHAHGAGVLHRDVKPENVFLEEAGGGEVRVKLLDFGIARALDPDAWSSTNLAQGTAGYVAPEVLQGGEPSERSDLYSLGVVLYECLTGLLPVGKYRAPSALRRGLPPGWDELLDELLESEPESRPPAASAVRGRLVQLGRPGAPRAPAPPPSDRQTASRRRWPALLVVALLGAAAVTAWKLAPWKGEPEGAMELRPPEDQAQPASSPESAAAVEPPPTQEEAEPAPSPKPEGSEPLVLAQLEPAEGAEVEEGVVTLTGRVSSGELESVEACGRPCELDRETFRCACELRAGDREVTVLLRPVTGEELRRTVRLRVRSEVERLLSRAGDLERRDRLTVGDENAVSLYREVLRAAPENEPAHAGLERIRDRFLTAAREALSAGDLAEAERQLAKAELATSAEHSGILSLREQVAQARDPIAAARRRLERALKLTFVEVNAAGYEVYEREADGARMILVPGGSFQMGSENGDADEKPVHGVELSPYLLDETEVTWERYVRKRRSPEKPSWHPGGQHPVVNVSWEDASAYCASVRMKLPTEAQWEYAARGPRSLRYPWGESWDARKANGGGSQDGHEYTAPVGSFPSGAGPFGHLDLAGNVYEWVNDWYSKDAYASRAGVVRDPTGPRSGSLRVLRGGSFGYYDYSHARRGAYRGGVDPSGRGGGVGFRCAQDVP